MTKPESLPVEEARKRFADVLDGSQFRSTHTEITRRGKAAGVVVPPEWYEQALQALAGERPKASPPAAAPSRQQVTQSVPEHETVKDSVISPQVLALHEGRVKELAEAAEGRHPEWVRQIRAAHPNADEHRMRYLIVEAGVREGFRLPTADTASSKEQTA